MKITRNEKLVLEITLPILILSLIILRMYISEADFFLNNFWAEDGLFTLCYAKSTFVDCISDSYSGYLLLYPRLISYIVFNFQLIYGLEYQILYIFS